MTQYVFDTRRLVRYRFPTHTNDLILDRSDATSAEAFLVRLEPGEEAPVHVHPDAEQLFYVLDGEGELAIGPERNERHALHVGDLARTPPGVPHSARCIGDRTLVYLSVDCFTAGPPPEEPTWDSHIRQLCADQGWEFDAVKLGPIET